MIAPYSLNQNLAVFLVRASAGPQRRELPRPPHFRGRLSSFRAENTTKSEHFKAENNAQTTSEHLQNNFQTPENDFLSPKNRQNGPLRGPNFDLKF